MARIAALIGLCGWVGLARAAGPTSPKGYVCPKANGPIVVDGRLDEPAWSAARWTDDFQDIEGDVRPRPRFRTRARMTWDDRYFYIAAELEEPDVWGTLTKHDSVIFHDNDFEVFIDPDGDNHEYYEVEINALNTEWDLFLRKPYRDGGPAVDAWEIPGLKTAVHVAGTLNDPKDKDQGWTVELALPWKALAEYAHRPAPPRVGDRWRVNFSRVEWHSEVVDGKYRKVEGRREDNWVWSPQGAIDMHRPERWGYVEFRGPADGDVPFRPDPARPALALLERIYHAQADYRKRNGRWAASLEELELGDLEAEGLGRPTIERTGDGYCATVELKAGSEGPRRWHVRQDSRTWAD